MFYVFLYIVSYITYASSIESKVWLDAVTIFQINNMQKGGFLRNNEIILIHQTTNFYATLAPKTFLRILTIWFYASNRHHVPWFKSRLCQMKCPSRGFRW